MIVLTFPGVRPQSKRNSQFRNGIAYVEPHYRLWRRDFGALARRQYSGEPIAAPVAVSVTFATVSGKLRGDLDNGFAGVADGLMDGGVLADDKWIRRLSAEVVKAKRGQHGITVTIETVSA